MEKRLKIDCYFDGFKSSDLNCIDLPIAAACGAYGRDNYFYYCTLFCIYMNFFLDFQKNWFINRNTLLKKIGLELLPLKVNEQNLIDNIKQSIDEDAPIIMIVKYGSLFYSRYYGWGTYNHGIVVSDYNDEYELLGIRDREVIRDYIDQGVFTSDVMHRITLHVDQIREIWSKSNIKFGEEGMNHYNYIYSLHCLNKDINFYRVLEDIFESTDRKSMLLLYTQDIIKRNTTLSDPDIEAMRRVYYRTFLTLFAYIERFVNMDELSKSNYYIIKEKFMKHRLLTLNHIQLSIAKDRGKGDLLKWLEEDESYVNTLVVFLRRLFGELQGE